MEKVFLNTNALPDDVTVFKKYVYFLNKKRKEYYLMYSPKTVYLLTKFPAFMTEDEPSISVWQIQFPKKALPWIIDSIENGFWKKPSEGGLDSDVLHVKEVIDDNKLLLRFSPNCGSYQWPGIKLENYSVPWYISNYSEMDMPNNLLREHGLLQGFKDIAATL